jgi:hypothetical protein
LCFFTTRRLQDLERRDVGVGIALQPGIAGLVVVAAARAQPRHHVEARRPRGIGGDVVDRRQPVGAQRQVAGIGQQGEAEKKSGRRAADPAQALPPDHHRRGE